MTLTYLLEGINNINIPLHDERHERHMDVINVMHSILFCILQTLFLNGFVSFNIFLNPHNVLYMCNHSNTDWESFLSRETTQFTKLFPPL